MSSQIIPVNPFDFVIFGATGDLAERKLLPALYHRQQAGQFTEPTRIIGASRSAMSSEDYRKFAEKALRDHLDHNEIDSDGLSNFLNRLSYVPVDAKSGDGFAGLKSEIGESSNCRAFYLAVGPSLFRGFLQSYSTERLDQRQHPYCR